MWNNKVVSNNMDLGLIVRIKQKTHLFAGFVWGEGTVYGFFLESV